MAARALAIAIAALAACAGPDPEIERVDIVPPRLPGHVRVKLVVANRNAGHGQVQIEIRLRDARSRNELAAERMLEIDGPERIELIVDIPAPDGDYSARAHALYPE